MSKPSIKFIVLTIIYLFSWRMVVAQETKETNSGLIHIESQDKGSITRSVTLKILQKMITDAETNTKTMKVKDETSGLKPFVSERTVLSDTCMGADQYEHDQLGEGAIVCLLGITKEASELPFAKVYFEKKDGTGFDLILLATLPPEKTKALRTNGTLGHHLWVALYWIPRVRSLEGQILVDFRANRTRFRPGIDLPFPKSFGQGLKDKGSGELIINVGTMKEVIEREYPGMEIAPEILEAIKGLNRS